MPFFEGLFEHKARLGQGALAGIDEQDHTVDHAERTFYLSAKVGVARGVDDVDLGALPRDGAVFGADGDSALFFKVATVHDALGHVLVFAEGSGLFEKGIHERGFAVVDVGDDGDVAQRVVGRVGVSFHRWPTIQCSGDSCLPLTGIGKYWQALFLRAMDLSPY